MRNYIHSYAAVSIHHCYLVNSVQALWLETRQGAGQRMPNRDLTKLATLLGTVGILCVAIRSEEKTWGGGGEHVKGFCSWCMLRPGLCGCYRIVEHYECLAHTNESCSWTHSVVSSTIYWHKAWQQNNTCGWIIVHYVDFANVQSTHYELFTYIFQSTTESRVLVEFTKYKCTSNKDSTSHVSNYNLF